VDHEHLLAPALELVKETHGTDRGQGVAGFGALAPGVFLLSLAQQGQRATARIAVTR